MYRKVIDETFGNIMVIVPHQDDEILMAAGIMKQAVACGLQVHVVMATNGDYDFPHYETGRKRLQESIRALEVLGIPKENFIILGYADTGMDKKDSFLTRLYESTDADVSYMSKCTSQTYGLKEQNEYHFFKYGEHANYTKKNCYEDLRSVIETYQPENIFTTSEEDMHGDHSGLFFFVRDILTELKKNGYVPDLYSGIVHSKAEDEYWPERTEKIEPLTCPKDFDALGAFQWEERIVFDVPEEMKREDLSQNTKAIALSKHITALKPDAIEFLYSFIKADEIFWKIN